MKRITAEEYELYSSMGRKVKRSKNGYYLFEDRKKNKYFYTKSFKSR